MVPDIQSKPSKQKARWLFCGDISINKNLQSGFNWYKNDDKVSKLWFIENESLVKMTQTMPGVKEKAKRSDCISLLWGAWHMAQAIRLLRWQRH